MEVIFVNTEKHCEKRFKKFPSLPPKTSQKQHQKKKTQNQLGGFDMLKTFCQLHSRLKFVHFMVGPISSCKKESKGLF